MFSFIILPQTIPVHMDISYVGNPITLFTMAYDLALNHFVFTTSVMLLLFQQQDVF